MMGISAKIVYSALVGLAAWMGNEATATEKLVSSHKNWGLWCEGQCSSCALSATAVKTVNLSPGQEGSRSAPPQTFLLVYFGGRQSGAVSSYLAEGYRPHSMPDLTIDGRRFQLFAEGNRAWSVDGETDEQIIKAMQKGLKALISGVSANGRVFRHKVLLDGFSVMWRRALKRCKK